MATTPNGAGPILPSVDTVRGGTYRPLSRPVFIYASLASLGRPEVKQFVEFYAAQAKKLVRGGRLRAADRLPSTRLVAQRVKKQTPGSMFGSHHVEPDHDDREAADRGAVAPRPPAGPTRMNRSTRSRLEFVIERGLFACAALSILVTAGIVGVLLFETYEFLREVPITEFLFGTVWTPLFSNKQLRRAAARRRHGARLGHRDARGAPGGAAERHLPERVRAAAPAPRRQAGCSKLLAGVPTVVYGYFALLFVTPLLQRLLPDLSGFNALSPGIVMGIMILPLVSSLSEDALHAVPLGLREGAYALGATRMQTTLRVVVPAAISGISAAAILAVSRAIGETMIVAIAAGQQPRLTLNPLVPIETMTAFIVQVSMGDTPVGTLEYKTIFAVGMLLFVGTLALNLVSNWLRQRFREVYR